MIKLFYPCRCPYCKTIIGIGKESCNECARSLPEHGKLTLITESEDDIYCVSPFVYRGGADKSILNFKLRGYKCFADAYALSIYRELDFYFSNVKFDAVTAVPMARLKRISVGYNHSKVLGKSVAELLRTPYKDLLVKVKNNKEQHKLSAEERALNVLGVYSAKRTDIIKGKTILLCDDIVTTGSTLRECSKILMKAGAARVICASIAKAGKI